MVYDNSVVLNFSKSGESAVAAVGHKDYNDFEDIDILMESYESPELSPEELAEMGPDEIREYEESREAILEYKETMRKTLDEYDPYYHGMRVLDTDYDSYLLMYHCNEDFDEELYHTRSISVYVRDHGTDVTELIEKLKAKVPGVDFEETHGLINHSLCPEGDLFLTEDAVVEGSHDDEENLGEEIDD
jgi:hypothetical protein